ncbi:MAG: 4-hydroxy-3-methylbut-2-enyl diphosphate reductase [Chitinispirillaceae bacterium]|jgi:4-hydroxy-3-methylbut-2-enyl diphosphate reductase|nr:4-hydroxy-3-methylbut-2-enyl diphosphate reductase [Chitinispirillaceae bacterium]
MKIIVSKTAGFCMGVKRAVDLALENAGRVPGGLRTIGPLIHNRQTIEMLRERRIVELDENESGAGKATLIIRAHGVPPETQKRFEEQGHAIIDGTCPKVKTVHKVITRYRDMGYRIVIAGDEGHAEVVGLLGYAGDAGQLVCTPEEIDALPAADKICLVSQTTFDRELFDRIARRFRERFPGSEAVVKKTICAATDQRQAETETLARQVDALIVVGGRNSANTQRLGSISAACGTPTQLVETEADIDWPLIASCKTVGVTAGASTPNWMIRRVTDYLQFKDQTERRSPGNSIRQFFEAAANMNLFVAFGAVAVCYASSVVQGELFTPTGGMLAFLYFLAVYLWNSVTSIDATSRRSGSRQSFYDRNKALLLTISALSVIALCFISFAFGKTLFSLTLFAILVGSVYHVTIVPPSLRRFFPYRRLRDIPTSRDLFVALAWATLLTCIPQAVNGPIEFSLLTIVCFGWIFVLAFLRSLVFDLRDIEGDRILGRETLVTIVGEKRAREAIRVMIWSSIALLVIVPWALHLGRYQDNSMARFLFQIPALFYAAFFLRWNPRLKSNLPAIFNVMADGIFYIAGIGALCAAALLKQ